MDIRKKMEHCIDIIKQNKLNIIKIIVYIMMINSISWLLVFSCEFIIREKVYLVYEWMRDYSIQVLCSVLLCTILITVCTILTGNLGVGTLICGGVYEILAIISYYKYSITNNYLLLNDLILAKEGLNIIQDFNISFQPHILWCVMLLIWLVMVLVLFRWRSSIKCKILSIGIISVFICLMVLSPKFLNSKLTQLGIQDLDTLPAINTEKNGMLVSLIMDIPDSIVHKPDNYNKQYVLSIVNKYQKQNEKKDFIEPNVIMIMDEAMFDITKFEGVELSEDPLANFHKYQEEFISGDLIVPVYGGGTAQTEFEVMTGNSVDLINNNSIAYTSYINNNTSSILDIFKMFNYKTVAIHPYDKNFYNRQSVYQKMGFDSFISEEYFMSEQKLGRYISDLETFKKIINEYEKNKGNSSFFSYVVTMQNHAPYAEKKDQVDIGVDVKNKDFSNETLNEVEAYVNLLKHTDAAIKYLIEYFEKVDEPTVIVIFGDHIPLLGDFYDEIGVTSRTLTENGIIGTNSENAVKMYTTPLLVWDNYGLTSDEWGKIDSSQLGIKLLKYLNAPLTNYLNVVDQIASNMNAYNKLFFIDKEGKVFTEEQLHSETNITRIIDDWEIIQYDHIFGKKYMEEAGNE